MSEILMNCFGAAEFMLGLLLTVFPIVWYNSGDRFNYSLMESVVYRFLPICSGIILIVMAVCRFLLER